MLAIGVVAVLAAQPAVAQPQPDALQGNWTATTGTATFSSRDGTTTEASPMAWEGIGETLAFRYERSRPARLHRFDVGFSAAGRFTYESPLRSTAGEASDSARWINAQYEYRRRILGRWLPDRINTGIGVQARGSMLAISRHLAPSIENDEREARFEGAPVLAARVRVSRHLAIEGAWAPGLIRVARLWIRQSADADGSIAQRAIGWSAETSLRADMPITPRASIVVDYLRTSEETDSHFHSFTAQTNRLAFGVRYGR
jgi:hypothetical protein